MWAALGTGVVVTVALTFLLPVVHKPSVHLPDEASSQA
jgi:hypothetical protein